MCILARAVPRKAALAGVPDGTAAFRGMVPHPFCAGASGTSHNPFCQAPSPKNCPVPPLQHHSLLFVWPHTRPCFARAHASKTRKKKTKKPKQNNEKTQLKGKCANVPVLSFQLHPTSACRAAPLASFPPRYVKAKPDKVRRGSG